MPSVLPVFGFKKASLTFFTDPQPENISVNVFKKNLFNAFVYVTFKKKKKRVMRRKLAKKYMDEGYKIREQKGRRDEIVNGRHEIRERRIDKLRAMYGKNYNPNWDAGRTPRIKDAVRMRTGGDPGTADCYEQSYDGCSEGEAIGIRCDTIKIIITYTLKLCFPTIFRGR